MQNLNSETKISKKKGVGLLRLNCLVNDLTNMHENDKNNQNLNKYEDKISPLSSKDVSDFSSR